MLRYGIVFYFLKSAEREREKRDEKKLNLQDLRDFVCVCVCVCVCVREKIERETESEKR